MCNFYTATTTFVLVASDSNDDWLQTFNIPERFKSINNITNKNGDARPIITDPNSNDPFQSAPFLFRLEFNQIIGWSVL